MSEKISPGLSKLRSTCSEEHFEHINFSRKILQLTQWQSANHEEKEVYILRKDPPFLMHITKENKTTRGIDLNLPILFPLNAHFFELSVSD